MKVAQIGNLPYRRMIFGRALTWRGSGGLPIRDTTASLRYGESAAVGLSIGFFFHLPAGFCSLAAG
jgi:hypothetical protein